MNTTERVRVSFGKEILINKVWRNSSWAFQVKKYTLLLGMLSIAGWSEESGLRTHVDYFPTFEEAKKRALDIKRNYLGK